MRLLPQHTFAEVAACLSKQMPNLYVLVYGDLDRVAEDVVDLLKELELKRCDRQTLGIADLYACDLLDLLHATQCPTDAGKLSKLSSVDCTSTSRIYHNPLSNALRCYLALVQCEKFVANWPA